MVTTFSSPEYSSPVFTITATGNHLKQNLLNQASSDSELARYRANKLSNSLSNIANDVLFKKSQEKDNVHTASKQGIFLPMQNMKHNVTEKVAQVRPNSILFNYLFFRIKLCFRHIQKGIFISPDESRGYIGFMSVAPASP